MDLFSNKKPFAQKHHKTDHNWGQAGANKFSFVRDTKTPTAGIVPVARWIEFNGFSTLFPTYIRFLLRQQKKFSTLVTTSVAGEIPVGLGVTLPVPRGSSFSAFMAPPVSAPVRSLQ
jgi:hypothetical protein